MSISAESYRDDSPSLLQTSAQLPSLQILHSERRWNSIHGSLLELTANALPWWSQLNLKLYLSGWASPIPLPIHITEHVLAC